MRLPPFRYRAPRSIEEAAAWLAESPGDSTVVAGGTDLLPKMKRRQQVPATLIGLSRIAGFAEIRGSAAPSPGVGAAIAIRVGAGITLTELMHDDRVKTRYPGLWQAAAQVATPHLRNMGTLGGNLCLDTRCTYYDQSFEWRKAIGFCMKKAGETCWVATSSPRCLAVSSTDTAPMLQALGARVQLVSSREARVIDVGDLYQNDGIDYLTRRPDEILTEVQLPDAEGWRSTYWKLRRRGSFDFPVASVAAAARFDGDRIAEAHLVLGAVASRPMSCPAAAAVIVGKTLTDPLIDAAADAAYVVAKPMDNTDFELVWRKKMVHALAVYALRELRGDDMRAARRSIARRLL